MAKSESEIRKERSEMLNGIVADIISRRREVNPLAGYRGEFHIVAVPGTGNFNSGEDGMPKTADIGRVIRGRISPQSWARATRMRLHEDEKVEIGMRTRKVENLVKSVLAEKGHDLEDPAVKACIAGFLELFTNDVMAFISRREMEIVRDVLESGRILPLPKKANAGGGDKAGKDKEEGKSEGEGKGDDKKKKKKSPNAVQISEALRKCVHTADEGLDIALFGRMVASDPTLAVSGAAAFAHAITSHRCETQLDFFSAVDEFGSGETQGSGHINTAGFNSPVFYRYIWLDLGQLWENLEGRGLDKAIGHFIRAAFYALPGGKRRAMPGSAGWSFARVLVREKQPMQVSFETAVQSRNGFVEPTIERINRDIARKRERIGKDYGLVEGQDYIHDLTVRDSDEDEAKWDRKMAETGAKLVTLQGLVDGLSDFVRPFQKPEDDDA